MEALTDEMDFSSRAEWELHDGRVVTIVPGHPGSASGADSRPADRILALFQDERHPLQVVGSARLLPSSERQRAQIAIEVDPAFRCHGLGTRLLHQLVPAAHTQGVTCLTIEAGEDDHALQRCCLNAGFTLQRDDEAHVVRAQLTVSEPGNISGTHSPNSDPLLWKLADD